MAGNRSRLNHVESCQLGKFGSDGVALKINFVMGTAGPRQSAEFAMSAEVARGLADALKTVLDDSIPAKRSRIDAPAPEHAASNDGQDCELRGGSWAGLR